MFKKGETYLAKLNFKEMMDIDKQIKIVLDIEL